MSDRPPLGPEAMDWPPPELMDHIMELARSGRLMDLHDIAAQQYALAEYGTPEQIKHLRPVLRDRMETAKTYHRLKNERDYMERLEAQRFMGQAMQRMLDFVPDEEHKRALAAVEEMLHGSPSDGLPSPARGLH